MGSVNRRAKQNPQVRAPSRELRENRVRVQQPKHMSALVQEEVRSTTPWADHLVNDVTKGYVLHAEGKTCEAEIVLQQVLTSARLLRHGSLVGATEVELGLVVETMGRPAEAMALLHEVQEAYCAAGVQRDRQRSRVIWSSCIRAQDRGKRPRLFTGLPWRWSGIWGGGERRPNA